MKYVDWDVVKNEILKNERGVSFEEVAVAMIEGGLLDIMQHPKPNYSHQKLMIVDINNYAYLVPLVEDEKKVFLKTIIPSRKATKIYLIEKGGRK